MGCASSRPKAGYVEQEGVYCPTSAGSLISSAQSAAQGTSLQEYAVRMSTAENAPQLEDFDSLAVLGKGGFGIVRLVRHRTTGSTYAVRGHLLSLSLSLSLFPSLSLSLSLFFSPSLSLKSGKMIERSGNTSESLLAKLTIQEWCEQTAKAGTASDIR